MSHNQKQRIWNQGQAPRECQCFIEINIINSCFGGGQMEITIPNNAKSLKQPGKWFQRIRVEYVIVFRPDVWSWEKNNGGNLPVAVQTGFGVNLFWELMPQEKNQPGSLNPPKFQCQGLCLHRANPEPEPCSGKPGNMNQHWLFQATTKKSQKINTAVNISDSSVGDVTFLKG